MTSRRFERLCMVGAIGFAFFAGVGYMTAAPGVLIGCALVAIVLVIVSAGARQMCAIVLAIAGAAALGGCAAPFGAGTLEHWPARDELYMRYCALEIRQSRIKASEFDSCLHRLKEHRGDVCTHRRAQ